MLSQLLLGCIFSVLFYSRNGVMLRAYNIVHAFVQFPGICFVQAAFYSARFCLNITYNIIINIVYPCFMLLVFVWYICHLPNKVFDQPLITSSLD